MTDILLDSSATFAADAVFVPAKVNATPRVAGDSWRYSTAQRATVGDDSMIALNSWLQGDSPAGASGKEITTLGGVIIAEKSGISGAIPVNVTGDGGLALGSSASTIVASLNFRSSSSGEILFGDAGSAKAGGLIYDHSANSLTVSTLQTSRFVFDATGMMPSAHVTYDFGADLNRLKKLWTDQLDVKSSANFGNGATAFDLAIDGGAAVGQEPRIRFCQAGTPIAAIRILSGGGDLQAQTAGAFDVDTGDALICPRMDTTSRNGLADVAAKVVYDTTVKALFVNDGAVWNQVSANEAGMEPILLTRSNSILPIAAPAAYGELGGKQPVLEFVDASTTTAFWYVQIPSGYAGGDLNVKLWWAGLLGALGPVAWQWGFERFQDLDNLNLDGSNFPAHSLHASDLISQRLNSFTRVFTNADMDSIQAGDTMRLTLRRYGALVSDLYGGTMTVLGMQITQ